MAKCTVCKRDRKNCKIFPLTEAEMDMFRKLGVTEPPKEMTYCQPCWKTLSDPVSSPAFLKGLFQTQLKQLGVANAEDLASKFHIELLKKASKPRS